MSIYQEALWKKLEEKANAADKGQPEQLKCEHTYLAAIRRICTEALSLAKTIRDMFPLYTLHDEVHISNVLRLMEKLLGNHLETLSRDETAMLILAACCHDIGMSCSERQLQELLDDRTRLEEYLEDHPAAFVKAKGIEDFTKLPDDLLRDFLRTIHPERINDILLSMEWPEVLQGKVNRSDLIAVCQSHGEGADKLLELDSEYGIDLRMCAVLLRLADILDFDTSRAPQAVYRYSGFDGREDSASRFSRGEWEKHQGSHGFSFELVTNREIPYDLPYHATCPSMQVEQAVNSYLDWVDQELTSCQSILRYCSENWRDLILPRRIARRIDSEGYLSGQFCLTMDQDRVLELLVGKHLYQDSGVFVRELLQNAIDAVRTRQQLDRNLPRDWKPQINIHCWMDEEGCHWFRIEDNGIGMNEEIIKKYFLKVGCSYYTSDDFEREKYRCQADEDYMPISRFGIGILSCFMGDKNTNRVEISTKHFSHGSDALRMSMHGTNGYYYLANRKVCPRPSPMKGILPEEQRPYRNEAGTVIAVRTNLFQSGTYRSFRAILDQYVAYPPVPVHYEDEQGSFDYPTEQQMMDAVHKVHPSDDLEQQGILEFSPTNKQLREVEQVFPGLIFHEAPVVTLKCAALDQYTESPHLSGAVLLTKVSEGNSTCEIMLGNERVEAGVNVRMTRVKHQLMLNISLSFSDEFRGRIKLYKSQQEAMEEQLDDVQANVISGAMDISVCRAYDRVSSTYCTITLCDLATLPWYRQYFADKCKDKQCISLTAHNGVFCGNAKFFVSQYLSDNLEPLDVILLLKDHYRPEMDIARTGVQRLPLETAVELELLYEEWVRQGYYILGVKGSVTNYRTTPLRVYYELIKKRPDLVNRLRFQTDQGEFRAGGLPEALRKYGRLKLAGGPKTMSIFYYPRNQELYLYFCMAYLKKEFALVGKCRAYDWGIYLLPGPAAPPPNIENFPPCLFLPVEEEDGGRPVLWGNAFWHFCNESHPLSKFLLDNQELLEKMAPGLLHELARSLAYGDRVGTLNKVNLYLKQIRSVPQGKIRVPEDAFLTPDDLVNSSQFSE